MHRLHQCSVCINKVSVISNKEHRSRKSQKAFHWLSSLTVNSPLPLVLPRVHAESQRHFTPPHWRQVRRALCLPRSSSALISHRWIENETVTLGDINYNRSADWLNNKRFLPPALSPTLSTELSRYRRFAWLCSVCKHAGITTRRSKLKWHLTVAGSSNLQYYRILQKYLSHAALMDLISAFRDAFSEETLSSQRVRCSTRLLLLEVNGHQTLVLILLKFFRYLLDLSSSRSSTDQSDYLTAKTL